MGNTFYLEWEVKLMEFLQSHMTPFLTNFASFISTFGEEIIIVIVLGFLYWGYDKKAGIRIGITLLLANLFNPFAKNIAKRRRPYMDNEGIQCLKPIDSSADIMDISAQGYSFPSGHSTCSSVVFGSLESYYKKPYWLVISIVLPFLVGVSRFCLGVHYPTDVLAGWAIGYLFAFGFPWLCSKFKNERILFYIFFGVGCCGFFFCRTNDYYSALGMVLGMLLGTWFEKRFVNFKNSSNIFICLLRLAIGGGLYFGINFLLKLPFSDEILESATMLQFVIRFFRYAIILFLLSGVYPMIFGKIIKEKKKQ